MFLKKFNKYKPLFKKFVKLNENVQNKPLNKFLKFKKVKWQFFIKNLIKYNYKKKLFKKDFFFSPQHSFYKFYDINKNLYFFKGINLKKKTNYFLNAKRKFNLFYGMLSKVYIKSQLKNQNSFNIENRLDVVLYRAFIALTIKQARYFIKKNYIKVNNFIVSSYAYLVKTGDLITVAIKEFITINIVTNNLWPIVSNFFIVNYKTLEIIITQQFKFINLSILYPFWINYNLIKNFYKC